MKNILVVQGGGRINGNTSQLADSFIQALRRPAIQLKRYL